MTDHDPFAYERNVTLTSRRSFIVGSGAGLFIGVLAGCDSRGEPEAVDAAPSAAGQDLARRLQAYLQIHNDGRVVIQTPMAEMGQGVLTSLPLILAEELEADWDRIDVRLSDGDPIFESPEKGTQATGRSMSVRGYFTLLRELGAAARDMLERAAAAHWDVPRQEVQARKGQLLHGPTGRSLDFSDVAEQAALLAPPGNPVLKPTSQFRLIGTQRTAKDVLQKVTGRIEYAIDGHRDVLVATVRMAPVLGARIGSVDAAKALQEPGVRDVVRFGGQHIDLPYPSGVAVVAESYWQARRALDLVEIQWIGGESGFSSTAEAARRRERCDDGGVVSIDRGDFDNAFGTAAANIDVVYEAPYLAHATMEPMTCVADASADGCILWSPSQGPEVTKAAVAELLGIPPDKVTLHRMHIGGGFGRRYQRDFALQAAEISRAIGAPVKLIWSREQDIRHDFFRPAQTMRLRACVDAAGALTGLHAKAVGPSLLNWGQKTDRLKGRADPTSFSGINDTPYAIPNFRTEWVDHPTPVPIGVWRSVGHSHNGYFLECAIDEAATAAAADPYAFRKQLLADQPRQLRVLDAVAGQSGWDRSPPIGQGRGIAIMQSYGSVVAHVADVSVVDHRLVIHKIDVAVDCGLAIDPHNVESQMQGGTIFALTALLYGAIDIEAGAVKQSNFHDYRILTMQGSPPIDVTIVESDSPIGGIGECAVPTAFSSVVNAVYAATGKRIRSLPLQDRL